jgi:hypothetical protein
MGVVFIKKNSFRFPRTNSGSGCRQTPLFHTTPFREEKPIFDCALIHLGLCGTRPEIFPAN